MSDNSSQFVGSIPEYYDNCLGPNIFHDYADDMARRAADTGAQSVLELAAGTGIVTRRLRDAIPEGARLVASDLNAPMLKIAAAKFPDGEQIEFVPADAQALPFSDGEFDLLVCQFGVMFFPDRVASYREAARVLRPGGVYLFSTWGTMAENPFSQEAHATAAEFFPDDPPGFYRVPFSCADSDAVKRDLARAGWRDVAHVDLPLHKTVGDLAAFARGLVHGNPLIDEIRQRGGNPDAVVERIHQRLAARFRSSGNRMPLKTTTFVCRNS